LSSTTNSGTRWLEQAQPLAAAALRTGPLPEDARSVLGASFGPWDRAPGGTAPRRPGGIFALASDSPARVLLATGFYPCGRCAACLAGLTLACQDPVRPGWNAPGGLAEHARPEAWHIPLELDAAALPGALALVAGAGLPYQAMASAGMVPGDTVAVAGDPGPGDLPLRLLAAAGLRVVQLAGPARALPEGVTRAERLAQAELPSERCHLIDLAPDAGTLPCWLPAASRLLSATLCGPSRELAVDLGSALAGQCALRWIRDLHPHLALDLCAFVVTGRLSLAPVLEIATSVAELAERLVPFQRGELERWPVLSITRIDTPTTDPA
jgi:hypothetical protein